MFEQIFEQKSTSTMSQCAILCTHGAIKGRFCAKNGTHNANPVTKPTPFLMGNCHKMTQNQGTQEHVTMP